MLLVLVSGRKGKERNGTRVCVCLVWFCERERERRKQEKNIIFIIKKNPFK